MAPRIICLLSAVWLLSLVACSSILAVTTNHLTVVSYNIRHGVGMDLKMDLNRTVAVIKREKPDLVAIQEVDKNCRRSRNIKIAEFAGKKLNMESRFGAFMPFQGGEYGLAVLSKYPIISSRRIKLPDGNEPRCALEITVQPDGWKKPLHFVCIHNDWKTLDFRIKQVKALTKALKNVSDPILLAGDFNAEPGDASLELLVKDGWTIIPKQSQEKKTYPAAPKPTIEIDYFITKNFPDRNLVCTVGSEKKASDHRPIKLEISNKAP